MTTNEFTKIASMDQLRRARRYVSSEIISSEKRISSRLDSSIRHISIGKLIVPLVRKLRTAISGMPFAKS